MIYNWSKYRRKQNNLQKAEFNQIVNELITKHYRYLHNMLVKSDRDEATFNDTYLKLTFKYVSDRDFIEQFILYFKQLSGEFIRDDKCYNYAESKIEIYTDNIQSAPIDDITNEPEKQAVRNSDFITNMKQYAISEKSKKKANKAKQKGRKTKYLSK